MSLRYAQLEDIETIIEERWSELQQANSPIIGTVTVLLETISDIKRKPKKEGAIKAKDATKMLDTMSSIDRRLKRAGMDTMFTQFVQPTKLKPWYRFLF